MASSASTEQAVVAAAGAVERPSIEECKEEVDGRVCNKWAVMCIHGCRSKILSSRAGKFELAKVRWSDNAVQRAHRWSRLRFTDATPVSQAD